MKRTLITTFLLGSFLKVGNGFSAWHSKKNCHKNSLVEDGFDDLNARETLSSTAREATRSAVVAFVATTTALTGSWYLSPMPAFAKDTISMESTFQDSSALLSRTSPPSVTSFVERAASLVIANEETSNVGLTFPVAEEAVRIPAVVEQKNQQEEATGLAARQTKRVDPPGETYLLVQATSEEVDVVVEEATKTSSYVGVASNNHHQPEDETAALTARQRAREDPPGETYLLVQAATGDVAVKEPTADILGQAEETTARQRVREDPPGETFLLVQGKAMEEATELAVGVELTASFEKQVLVADIATDVSAEDEGIPVFTTELTKEEEDNMVADFIDREEDLPPENTIIVMEGEDVSETRT
ncbi:MAG: hypothetical protein SGBAC_006265 [Bacillariaceae sp.]